MAVRQYVGARYVPRFVGNYDVTQSYEALDVVDNGQGTSYIAKKPTPAGTPLTDTNYWFLYGSTSGAIVNLQQQINDMKDGTVPGSLQEQINTNTSDITTLTDMHNRVFILCGDSLGSGYTPGVSPQKGWSHWVKEIIEAGGGIAYRVSTYGAGFGVSGNTWLMGLQDQESAWADIADKVTDVLILGGSNDISANGVTESDITNGMTATFTYIREHYPNAKISVGILAAIFNLLCQDSASTYNTYRDVSIKNGACFLSDLRLLATNPDYVASDNTHLTQAGYEFISPYIYDCVIKGHTDFTLFTSAYPISYASGMTESGTRDGKVLYTIKPNTITAEYYDASNNAPLTITLSDTAPASATIKQLFTQNPILPTGSPQNVLGDATLFSVEKADTNHAIYHGLAKIMSWNYDPIAADIRVFYPVEYSYMHSGDGLYNHYLTFNQFVYTVK